MSEKVLDPREAERFGFGETTSRGPTGLCALEGRCFGVELARSGLIEWLIEGGLCDEG